jgi:hypothetical protein
MEAMIVKDSKVVEMRGLNYIVGADGKPVRYKPWIGSTLSFLYDFVMRKKIFPKKFGSDMAKHYDILRHECEGVRGKNVLELASGSGSAVHFLQNDNRYAGIDVSPGLLKRAVTAWRSEFLLALHSRLLSLGSECTPSLRLVRSRGCAFPGPSLQLLPTVTSWILPYSLMPLK